jgi:hypothetical protein
MELKLQDRQVKAKEDHTKAKKAVEDCRQNLEYAKQQVYIPCSINLFLRVPLSYVEVITSTVLWSPPWLC